MGSAVLQGFGQARPGLGWALHTFSKPHHRRALLPIDGWQEAVFTKAYAVGANLKGECRL